MIEDLLDVIAGIRVGDPPQLELDDTDTVPINTRPRRGRDYLPGDVPRETSTARVPVAASSPDLPGRKDIWVSYAWGDDQSEAGRQRQIIVDGACEALRRRGWTVHRDRDEMRQGDWISDYMKAIGRADRVLVILSEKYLQSPNCMTELHYVYQRSLREKHVFRRCVVPLVLDDARHISRTNGRIQCAEFWQEQHELLNQAIQRKPKLIGRNDFDLCKRMDEWSGSIGDMLSFIADQLHPNGFDNIMRDDYAGLFELLDQTDRGGIS